MKDFLLNLCIFLFIFIKISFSNELAFITNQLSNNVSVIDLKTYKVIKEIPRCSATNIKPKTSDINLNIPLNLKKIYNHINLGIYLDPLNDGKINKGDLIKINE